MSDVEKLQEFLKWVKTSPFEFDVTGMQGGFVRVKFYVDEEKDNECREWRAKQNRNYDIR